MALDMRDDARIDPALAEAEAALGPIDILINNAGINYGKRAVNMTAAGFDDDMGTNLRGPWLLACAFARRLIECQAPAHREPGFDRRIHLLEAWLSTLFSDQGGWGAHDRSDGSGMS